MKLGSFLALIVLISLFSCGKSENKTEVVPRMERMQGDSSIQIPTEHEAVISWSAEEQQYIDDLKSQGTLTITTRIRESVYEPDKYGAGQHGGMDYELISSFAEMLDLELDLKTVVAFSDYFANSGIVPDIEMQKQLAQGLILPYIPDPLKDSLILVDGFSRKDWREPLGTFVQTFPDKDVVLVRKDSDIRSLQDLKGKVLGVQPQSNPSLLLKEELLKAGIDAASELIVEDTHALAEAVALERIDAVAVGGITSLFELKNFDNLSIAFSLGSHLSWSHWIVKKEDLVLAGILEKYMKYARENGIIDSVWENQFSFSYFDFLSIIIIE